MRKELSWVEDVRGNRGRLEPNSIRGGYFSSSGFLVLEACFVKRCFCR